MMDVSRPKRVLAVSLESQAQHLSQAIQDLSGAAPTAESGTLAGTTHPLILKTQYYNATIPVWLDLVASPAEWASSFLSDEASEVLAVLGGLLMVFDATASQADEVREFVRHVGRVVNEGLGGWEWDGVRLAVGVGDGDGDEWDELCAEAGLEFVQVGGQQQQQARNEFGERTGMARVREALEANDWAQPDLDTEHLHDAPDDGLDGADVDDLKTALWSPPARDAPEAETPPPPAVPALPEPDQDDVAQIDRMMCKLLAVRDAGAGLGEAQRRNMAAKAVAEVMKEL